MRQKHHRTPESEPGRVLGCSSCTREHAERGATLSITTGASLLATHAMSRPRSHQGRRTRTPRANHLQHQRDVLLEAGCLRGGTVHLGGPQQSGCARSPPPSWADRATPFVSRPWRISNKSTGIFNFTQERGRAAAGGSVLWADRSWHIIKHFGLPWGFHHHRRNGQRGLLSSNHREHRHYLEGNRPLWSGQETVSCDHTLPSDLTSNHHRTTSFETSV